MLALDDERPALTWLTAAERLAWVDSLTAAIAELIQQMNEKCGARTLGGLLDIYRMLEIMREDLAMVDDACNRAIVTQVQDLISVLRNRVERETLATSNL